MSSNRLYRFTHIPSKIFISSRNYRVPAFLNEISRQSLSSVSRKCSSVNGPVTTLPAPLDVPTRKHNQTAISYYFSLGKAYLHFYKTGLKNIYHNYKASQPIQNLIDSKYGGAIPLAVKAKAITRSDFQLLNRNWYDLKRVPLFGFIFAIFGEFTPILVVLFSNIVPLTCRNPAQITKERKKLENRRQLAFQQLPVIPLTGDDTTKIEPKQLAHICLSLGLCSRSWTFFGGPTNMILKRKLHRRLEYLRLDDQLIENAGGVHDMDLEELRIALIERGVDVMQRDELQLKFILDSWLSSRKRLPIEILFFTRPSEWPVKVKNHNTTR